ncbi:non-ribosomal peptide synthetase [Streptomyces goshikiensis]|uniref:non-ribosomal peptide synthetase n=1 Tax=Streptomyces goshikiensis TaxID=1942 RepID=UPI00371506EA
MSPTERLYLAAGDPRGAMALRIVIEGEGLPDPDELRAALARAADTCPGSRLVLKGRLWQADGPPPRLRHTAPADPGRGVPDPELLTGHTRRTDPPGCEVLVVPGTDPARSTLVFSASHALMDGHGALLWVREVFRALRGETARPAHAPETDHGLLRRLGSTGRRPAPAPDRPSPLGRFDRGTERTLWLRRTLPGHHAALTARLAQALADATGRPARAMVPADLRRHAPEITATGNLTLPLFLDLRPGTPWTVPQSRLLAALAEGRECAAGFETAAARLPRTAAALLLRAAQSAGTRADRYLATAVVSHLGRLHLPEYRGGGFTATAVYALPVHAPLVPVSLVAAETVTGTGPGATAKTEVTMGVRGGADLADRAARLLDAALGRVTDPTPAPPSGRGRAAGPASGSGPGSGLGSGSGVGSASASASGPASGSGPGPGSGSGYGGPTVVDLFRSRAARTPNAPALDGPEGVLTYAGLDRRSDAVAAELHRHGIGREDLVGLIVDRSPAGVAALWGILKAGAAYVPLDPAHPDARIGEVLRDSGARVCLTQRHLRDRLTRCVPGILIAAEDVPEKTPPPGAGPAATDLAYVMHTSGSTGRPKGVRIEHGSLVGFVRWMTDLCRVSDTTRFGFVSSYAFDISCFPLFLPLLAGGTAVLAPDAPSPAALRRLVTDHRADTLALTPSHLPLLTGAGPVRTLLLGGETLTPAAVRAARAAFGPDCRIINGYGPTEATVACLAHVVEDAELGEGAVSVPLGTPGPYARVDLIATDGTPVGTGPGDIGRGGEIVVSGPQVARGYLPGARDAGGSSPFTTRPDGTRGYRTGDLGRRLPGGAIAFAGRVDGQLKIAGHRVEPAETIAALEAHPAVRQAVVAARRRTATAAAVLCAYVVPRAPDSGSGLPALLRADLARRLPAHLVPAHLLLVDGIPSTVSGKADLDALPDPFGRRSPGDDTGPGPGPGAGPRDGIRERVAGHWAAVLGTDTARLGPDADFQALGGDSLALIEMLTAVSGDLLTGPQADRFMSRLECLVRDVTLDQVCVQVEAAQEEVPS